MEKDRSVTIHEKNMQLLMTEMFKTINNLNPSFMNEIFIQRTPPYDLRNTNTFLLPRVHTVNYGTETVRYRGQRIWRSLPQEIKDTGSVQQFKNKINFGKMMTVTADFANNIYRNSDFLLYRFLATRFYSSCYIDFMNFVIF